MVENTTGIKMMCFGEMIDDRNTKSLHRDHCNIPVSTVKIQLHLKSMVSKETKCICIIIHIKDIRIYKNEHSSALNAKKHFWFKTIMTEIVYPFK